MARKGEHFKKHDGMDAEAVRAYQESGNLDTPELSTGLAGRYAPVCNVMAAASAVQIPVWLLLSVGSYCRRQA